MTKSTKDRSDDFHTLSPQLVVDDADAAICFYSEAFGAAELFRNNTTDGSRVTHCELLLGDSRLFVHDAFPEQGRLSPRTLGSSPVTLHLYVDDVDKSFSKAVSAGAVAVMEPQDAFWGDRYGILRDPFGHVWSIASRLEDLAPDEIQLRSAQAQDCRDRTAEE